MSKPVDFKPLVTLLITAAKNDFSCTLHEVQHLENLDSARKVAIAVKDL